MMEIRNITEDIKFGAVLPVYGKINWTCIVKYAKAAEKFGYDSLWISDHLINPYIVEQNVPASFRSNNDALEVWTILSALSTVTSKCRLGTYVMCNNFRHPSLMAKMGATLDNISNGRFELGLGAGWLMVEHVKFGFPWDTHSLRMRLLKDSIKAINLLWSGTEVYFRGIHFNLEGAKIEPKPIQEPHPPIIVGGNSMEVRTIVAEVGDGWIPEGLSPKEYKIGVNSIRRLAKDFGREPNQLITTWGGGGTRTIINRNESSVKEQARQIFGKGSNIKDLPWIIGTPSQCIRKVQRYIDASATGIVAGFSDFPLCEELELFSNTVLSHFKHS